MKLQVFRTERAELDLLEIWLFIAEDSSDVADSFLTLLEEKAQTLATSPEMGRLRPELAAGDIRSFPIGRYVVFYEPREDGILIVRVLHGARDIETAF